MKTGKILAAALSLTLAGGAVCFNSQNMPFLTANAESYTTGDIITGIYPGSAGAMSNFYMVFPSSDEIGWGMAEAYATTGIEEKKRNYEFTSIQKHDDEKNIDYIYCGQGLCFYKPEGKTGLPLGLIVTHKDSIYDYSNTYHYYTELYYGGKAVVFDPGFRYDSYSMNVMPHEEGITSSEYTLPECEFDPKGKKFIGWDYNGETYQPNDKIDLSEQVTVVTALWKDWASLGDPTGDTKVDSNDATFVLVEYAKSATGEVSTLSEEQKYAADANKDAKIDSKDASAILSYYSYCSTGGKDSLEDFLFPKES